MKYDPAEDNEFQQNREPKRGVSFGTVFMLALTAATLFFSGFVLIRLSSGRPADLSGLTEQVFSYAQEDRDETEPIDVSVTAQTTAKPAAAVPAEGVPSGRGGSFTFTVGGTAAVEENIRKSGYIQDTKKYDYSDIMRLLDPEIRSHINIVFLENLLMDSAKVGRITVPGNAAEMLRAAGFNTAMCGFSGIWGHEAGGITETADMLKKQRINPVGIRTTENGNAFIIQEENGVRVALLGYTTMLKATTRTTMAKKGFGYMVPGAEAEGIAADIARVRAEGAQAVIVLMNWGSPGDKNPTKNQIALAQQIADAGADFIIGAGSRVPQRVEYLTRADGRQVFCAYSLGTLISDSRSPANRVGGYLLHVTASLDAEGNARAIEVYYTPTYVWKYRQDGKDYYRCVAANREAPDGMDQDQVNAMHKTLEAVQKALEGCPLLPSP